MPATSAGMTVERRGSPHLVIAGLVPAILMIGTVPS
jgi:hypothetical protein